MIDFHTHILPNIDDGSRSIDETFNLIKEAKEAGFEGIVLTSHYIEKYYETNVPERDVWVNAISENLRNKGMDIDVYLGNEIYMSENIMQLLIDGKASTINNSCYVLFEMPLNVEPMNLYDVIYSLQEHKLIPILAHPERYTFVQKEPELITDLIEKGVLMQANYASILGYYGEKAQYIVRKFFEHNMIHFLGSDVHRQNTIYKMIPQAMEKIEEIVGANKLEELTTINPKLAVNKKEKDDKPKISVALQYNPDEEAPKIIASGRGIIADKIIDKAKENDVPVYQDSKLANTLSKLEIGDMIPPELYGVVAEILVFVDECDRIRGKVKH